MNDLAIATVTIGTNYNAPIAAIGAVFFDIKTGKLGGEFYQELSLDSSLKHCRVGGDALAQLIRNGHSKFGLFMTDHARKMNLPTAMHNLCTFVRGGIAPRVWGMGATGDLTWIDHAITTGTVGLTAPWGNLNTRDIRTLFDVAGVDPTSLVKREGAREDALAEAKWRAQVVIRCMALLKPSPKGTKAAPVRTPAPVKTAQPAPCTKRYWLNFSTEMYYVAEQPSVEGDIEVSKAQYEEATAL